MTVVVKKTADDLMIGLGNMYDAMVADYAKFMVPDTDHKKTMNDDYANGIAYKFGKKYVKVLGVIVSLPSSSTPTMTRSSRRVTF